MQIFLDTADVKEIRGELQLCHSVRPPGGGLTRWS